MSVMNVHLGAYQKKPVMIELAWSYIYMYSCTVSKGGCFLKALNAEPPV